MIDKLYLLAQRQKQTGVIIPIPEGNVRDVLIAHVCVFSRAPAPIVTKRVLAIIVILILLIICCVSLWSLERSVSIVRMLITTGVTNTEISWFGLTNFNTKYYYVS